MAIVAANQDDSVKELYDAGADFVVYPHLLGSELLAKVVKKGILTKELVKIRTQHLEKVNNWEIINR